jgi:hypothetical protein
MHLYSLRYSSIICNTKSRRRCRSLAMPFGNLSNDPYLLIAHRSHGSSTDKMGYTILVTKSLVDFTPFKHYDLPEIVNIACTSPRLLLFATENKIYKIYICSCISICYFTLLVVAPYQNPSSHRLIHATYFRMSFPLSCVLRVCPSKSLQRRRV